MMLAGGKWDTFRMLTHPGTSILPAAFAAAETSGATGKEFIAGIAAGYEVMERMAADFIPTVMARGFHAGPVFGIFGAAVAAAKIMRLSEDEVNAAIGLSVNLAGGNLESGGLREGAAVRNAMLAVALAKRGSRGRETALEGRAGFYHAYTGNNRGQLTYSFVGDTQTSLDRITARLGQEWLFLETLYRIYSFPGYNIAHIDVTAKLCEEHDIRHEQVDRVEAVVNWMETQYPSPAFPTQREDTGDPRRGSTRFYTAYGVVKRGFPLLGSTNDPPEVLELMKRVTIIPSHQMPLFGPRITIFTKDGKSYTRQGTGREFMWDFNEETRRIREVIPGLPIPGPRFEDMISTCRRLDTEARADALLQLTVKG
jgi:2-methylcitrate dehydratase PrpD